MARSNKPIVWGPFAAGGTLTAFLAPALIVATLAASLDAVPAGLSYDTLHAFAANWLGKLVIAGVLIPSLWHAAHRLRITLHDLGLRADTMVAWGLYAVAAAASLMALTALLRI